jgi:hypothetical protein
MSESNRYDFRAYRGSFGRLDCKVDFPQHTSSSDFLGDDLGSQCTLIRKVLPALLRKHRADNTAAKTMLLDVVSPGASFLYADGKGRLRVYSCSRILKMLPLLGRAPSDAEIPVKNVTNSLEWPSFQPVILANFRYLEMQILTVVTQYVTIGYKSYKTDSEASR